mmetsp:Transcript_12741/g.29330  ORF Transcript_12741/g.29330 Transcript_12741/m.29330 type:complete len:254 (-) Transcript_12741:873-1634(-)
MGEEFVVMTGGEHTGIGASSSTSYCACVCEVSTRRGSKGAAGHGSGTTDGQSNGSVITKMVPWPCLEATHMPPCQTLTSSMDITSPKPMLRAWCCRCISSVMKGSNIFLRNSGAMPTPSSDTWKRTPGLSTAGSNTASKAPKVVSAGGELTCLTGSARTSTFPCEACLMELDRTLIRICRNLIASPCTSAGSLGFRLLVTVHVNSFASGPKSATESQIWTSRANSTAFNFSMPRSALAKCIIESKCSNRCQPM